MRNIAITSLLVCALISVGVFLFSKKQKTQIATKGVAPIANSQGISESLANSRASKLADFNRDAWDSFLSSSEEEMKIFASKVAKMNQDQISELTNQIGQFYREDNEAAQQWLAALCEGLGDLGEQPQALEITGSLMTQEGVANSERKLLYDWSEDSWDEVSNHFTKLVTKDDFIDHRQASIAVSLALGERKDQRDELVNWIDALDADPGMTKLQGLMIGKVITHASAEDDSLALAVELFEKNLENPRNLLNLGPLALKYSPEDPEKALGWIASLDFDNDVIRFDAFGNVLQEMVLTDFPKAGELLASENFLEHFYGKGASGSSVRDADGEITPDAKKFYDRALEAFATGMMTVSPKDVLDVSQAFFSEELRERYRSAAIEFIGDITENENSSS